MTKAQWSAVYDYCAEYGYDTPHQLLKELRENGTVERSTRLSDLSKYVDGKTYDDMFQFLGDNL
jgi:hypothetical protein